MGMIFRAAGLEVFVYAPPREHQPPHVHVESRDGGEVMVKLGDDENAPALWRNHHMGEADARKALRIVIWNQERFLEEWRRLHDA